MTLPQGVPTFNIGKYLDAFEQEPFASLLAHYSDLRRQSEHARLQLRRYTIGLIRSAVREWPVTLPEDAVLLVTTQEAALADIVIDAVLAGHEARQRSTVTKLRFILEPKDGGPIDEGMIALLNRYTDSIPTPEVMMELREAMQALPRPANVWTPDYEILIQYEDEMIEHEVNR